MLAPLAACPIADRAVAHERGPTTVEQENEAQASQNPEGHRYGVDCTWTDARAREFAPLLRALWSELPTEHSFSIWYGWAPSRPLPDMAFSVEGRAYIATYAIWTDPADDERHRAWVVDHTRGWPRSARASTSATPTSPAGPTASCAGELRPARADPRPPRSRRPLLLLPDRRRRPAQRRTRPPSAFSVCPVMAPAASEARKPTAAATSSGTRSRGMAWRARTSANASRRRAGLGRGRARQSGRHAVDGDPLADPARAPATGPTDQRRLAGHVGEQVGRRRAPDRVRDHEHDAAEPALGHRRRERLAQPHAASTLTACTWRQLAGSRSASAARSKAAAACTSTSQRPCSRGCRRRRPGPGRGGRGRRVARRRDRDGDRMAAGAPCRRDRAPDRARASGDDRDPSHGPTPWACKPETTPRRRTSGT